MVREPGLGFRRERSWRAMLETRRAHPARVTFLGVPRVELDALDRVRRGSRRFKRGSHRAVARFGAGDPDHLPLALGVDPLAELRMTSGETESGWRTRCRPCRRRAPSRSSSAATARCTRPGWPGSAAGDGSRLSTSMPMRTRGTRSAGSLYGHGTPMRRLIESGAVRESTGSSRSGCAATGPSRPRSPGWPSSGCGHTR